MLTYAGPEAYTRDAYAAASLSSSSSSPSEPFSFALDILHELSRNPLPLPLPPPPSQLGPVPALGPVEGGDKSSEEEGWGGRSAVTAPGRRWVEGWEGGVYAFGGAYSGAELMEGVGWEGGFLGWGGGGLGGEGEVVTYVVGGVGGWSAEVKKTISNVRHCLKF
jgi:hypothetical protein